ncbi:Phosphatidate phosphatase APP1-like protein [Elsinoe fawcettii]|nr:Phosphatidate phosphatase APP1-like protein [Elsinoe fawcettii]
MAYRSQADRGYSNDENLVGGRQELREPGARRKKIAGYLRAANELRQTYTQSWNRGEQDGQNGGSADFNNVAMVSTGEEQMILFPSYARRHIKVKPEAAPGSIQEVPGTGRDYRDTVGAGDAEFWKKQWENYEDDRAIVDVDVRGWVFTPHKGQMTRKQRLMVALARQLVGIPAPTNNASSSAASSRPTSPSRSASIRTEEELASQEATAIISKGEAEAAAARQGRFSERPADPDNDSIHELQNQGPGYPPRRSESFASIASSGPNGSNSQNQSTTQVSMSAAELAIANANLMTRLRPFMANPLTSTTINAFFYNETTSRQKSVTTDAYGHFSFRAALDFVPTHVRVIAMEDLSIQEEVKVVESMGVSLISDIDDTIRHSAITRGAREIFRNAFIRDLGDLTVEGVKEWYNKLADMGVQLHYVSNSPWQLFPVMTSFFSIAGLPKGSFHLKQYSGMLQGIFEPVAERKKATLERLFRDFPERRFLLIGDSGEADLEVYTDVVMENPGRVIGVFIRDVTMPHKGGFFDSSMGPLSGTNTPRGRHSRNPSVDSLSQAKRFSRPSDIQNDDKDLEAAIAASLADMERDTARQRRSIFSDGPSPTKMQFARDEREERRPPLPQRPSQSTIGSYQPSIDSDIGDLIDLRDDDPTPKVDQTAFSRQPPSVPAKPVGLSSPSSTPKPQPPSKPVRLRSASSASEQAAGSQSTIKPPPPRPRKPSSSIRPKSPSPLYQVQESSPVESRPSVFPDRQGQGVRGYAMQKLSSASNALPSISGQPQNGHSTTDMSYGYAASPRSMSVASNSPISPADTRSLHSSTRHNVPAPPPQRRNPGVASSAASTASRLSGYWNGTEAIDDATGQAVNKREEVWKRRWRRAKDIMDRQGVMLRSWRVGTDVMDECVSAVKSELDSMQKSDKSGQSRPLGR